MNNPTAYVLPGTWYVHENIISHDKNGVPIILDRGAPIFRNYFSQDDSTGLIT